MLLGTLSSAIIAEEHFSPDDVLVWLVSETMAEQCMPLLIPHMLTTSTDVGRSNAPAMPCGAMSSQQQQQPSRAPAGPTISYSQSMVGVSQTEKPSRLVVGRSTPEVAWAAVKVPALCSSASARHWFSLWIDRPSTSISTAATSLDLHPTLPSWTLRLLSLTNMPIVVQRSHNRTAITVEPGQPCVLQSYDTITVGTIGEFHRCASFRIIPTRKILSTYPVADGERLPVAADRACAEPLAELTSSAMSSMSSLVTFCTHPTIASSDHSMMQKSATLTFDNVHANETPVDALRRRWACSCGFPAASIFQFVMCDVAENAYLQFKSKQQQCNARDTHLTVVTGANDNEVSEHDDTPRSHVTHRRGDVLATRSAARLPQESRIVVGPPQAANRGHSTQSHVSDSDLSEILLVEPQRGVPIRERTEAEPVESHPPAKQLRREPAAETPESQCLRSDQLIVPATAHSASNIHRHSVSTGTSADPGSPTPKQILIQGSLSQPSELQRVDGGGASLPSSLQDSLDDRWDEHLAALEAQSAAVYHATLQQQQQQQGLHHNVVAESPVLGIGVASSSFGHYHSPVVIPPMAAIHAVVEQQESQLVCFDCE